MPLTEIEITPFAGELPPNVAEYIEAAKIQIDHFHLQHRAAAVPAFVPSDFDLVYRVMRSVREGFVAPGNRYCEWGSGFGIVAGLASQLGFDAYGIEISAALVHEAERLANHFGIAVEFVCGSLVPPGGESMAAQTVEFAWLSAASDTAYDELGLDATDFDIIFAYPWPGEEQAIFDLFDRFAAMGAVLITYHGVQGIRVQRKVAGKKRRR
ncbi:MAG TPA: class I SAM-dependent methyltransferase [Pirellulaceae bacterium]|nr:class I SAM-dependent methyltransferase [Pirellulaceae bacterium]